jgi:hypothetical protein
VTRRLLLESGGVKTFFHYDHSDGKQHITQEQDCKLILDHNSRLATMNDGYSPSRATRRVGSIPRNVLEGWLAKDGLSWQRYSAMPKHERRAWLNKRLLDGDWQRLLTAPRGTKYVQQAKYNPVLDAAIAAGRKLGLKNGNRPV